MSDDRVQVSRLVCQILHLIYVRNRARFERHARRRGIKLEQLAAAAIAEALLAEQGKA